MTKGARHPRGGIYFEEFEIGTTIEHRLTRTVTQMDNMLFSNMTLNPQPLHIDAHFCATETEWGQPLMNSLFTLGLMIGISVNDTTVGTTIANLGMTDVTFPAPLFEGDTVNCTTEIVAKRESRSRPEAGIVEFHHRAYKQDGTLVAQCRRQAFHAQAPRQRHGLGLMRSLLFVPGDSLRKQEKALTSGADALILDLEDSVAADAKARAREITRDFLNAMAKRADAPAIIVRVNALQSGMTQADLDAVMPAAPFAIMLPKSEGGSDVGHLAALIAVREAENELPDGQTRIIPIATETGKGIFGLGSYAGSSHRLAALTWGAEDLSADLGAETNRLPDGSYATPYQLARSLILFAASAAQVDAIDTVFPPVPRRRRLPRRMRGGAAGRLCGENGRSIPISSRRSTRCSRPRPTNWRRPSASSRCLPRIPAQA